MTSHIPTFNITGSLLTENGDYGIGMVEALLYYYSTTASDDTIQYILGGRCEILIKDKGIPSIFA